MDGIKDAAQRAIPECKKSRLGCVITVPSSPNIRPNKIYVYRLEVNIFLDNKLEKVISQQIDQVLVKLVGANCEQP